MVFSLTSILGSKRAYSDQAWMELRIPDRIQSRLPYATLYRTLTVFQLLHTILSVKIAFYMMQLCTTEENIRFAISEYKNHYGKNLAWLKEWREKHGNGRNNRKVTNSFFKTVENEALRSQRWFPRSQASSYKKSWFGIYDLLRNGERLDFERDFLFHLISGIRDKLVKLTVRNDVACSG